MQVFVYFISPVVNMEKLISDMMIWANITADELHEKKEIQTAFLEVSLLCKREPDLLEHPDKHFIWGERQPDFLCNNS